MSIYANRTISTNGTYTIKETYTLADADSDGKAGFGDAVYNILQPVLEIRQNDSANRSDMICTAPGNDLQNRFTVFS
ncbi:MAG: hypothetical protein GY795_22530 [Desulfobacterales bacterium]|nr:hypothetical protein [Desulfobacterales bacterium]